MSIIPKIVLIVNAIIPWYNGFMEKNNSYIRLVIVVALAYLFFVVGKTLYQSYQVRKEINGLKVEIENMRLSNKDLSEKILYYQSPSYQEKIARERLGLQKPGEKVIVILPEESKKVAEKDPYDKLTGPEKWWQFFFKG